MQRNLNIEFLRILCMLFIVIGHVSGRAGVDFFYGLNLMPQRVNCFILITGYFLLLSNFKFERILRTLITTIFYTFFITFIFWCFDLVSTWDLLKSIFPLGPTKFNYWFITKYLGLLFLSPFLQKFCLLITQKEYKMLLISLLLINSTLFAFFPFGELYGNQNSLLWMITMFLTGGYLRLYEPKFKYWSCGVLMFFLLYTGCAIYVQDIVLLQHNSLVIYVLAICTFMWVKNMKSIKISFFVNLISFIAPNTLAIYLIHEHIILRNTYIQDVFRSFMGIIPSTIYLLLFGCAVILISVLIDKVRVSLFDKLRISKIIFNIGKRIDPYYEGIVKKNLE